MNEIFGKTILSLEKSLDLRALRHDVILSNIANIDTPNYKSFDIIIKEEMEKIVNPLDNSENSKKLSLKQTNDKHLLINNSSKSLSNIDINNIKTVSQESLPLSLRGDKNTVEIEKEMVKLSDNSLIYSAEAQAIAKEFQLIKMAMDSKG